MQIDEQGQNYPNLTKKEREAMKELMNDCNIIISNNSTATESLSVFLDFHLKPLVTKVPHILQIKYLPQDALLVSFDVVGLYPHIPHEEGIEIMEEFLNQRKVKDISTKSLCDLATIILKNNFFEIGGEVYHQLLGTAIGTKFAPTYEICSNPSSCISQSKNIERSFSKIKAKYT